MIGPPEIGPWHLVLQRMLVSGKRLRLAVRQSMDPTATGLAAMLPGLILKEAGADLVRVRDGAPPPPYALVCLGSAGKRVGFHWGEAQRTTALDSEAHRRPFWLNRSEKRLADIEERMEAWFKGSTEPLEFHPVEPTDGGYQIHPLREGKPVRFPHLFRSVVGSKLSGVVLQDPYLLTRQQLKCLGNFLAAIASGQPGPPIPFRLITHLADIDPRRKVSPDTIRPTEHRTELERLFAAFPAFALRLQLCHWKHQPLHMRFVIFTAEDGQQRTFLLERGLDVVDATTGQARGNSWILEFTGLPEELRDVFPAAP
jgi:hypothetical protein